MTATKLQRATFVFALLIFMAMGQSAFSAGEAKITEKDGKTKLAVADKPVATKAAPKAPKKKAAKPVVPTEITASDISYDFNKGLALFIGNVHVVDATMDLRADEMQIYRNKTTGKFMKIIAFGKKNDIIMITEQGKAVGKQATYDLVKGTMLMTGDNLILETPGMKFVNPKIIVYERVTGQFKAPKGGRVIITDTGGQSFKSLMSIDDKPKKDDKKNKNTAKSAVAPEKKQP